MSDKSIDNSPHHSLQLCSRGGADPNFRVGWFHWLMPRSNPGAKTTRARRSAPARASFLS
jgi:hypothetical protein